ncbi:MAG: hypothetical protein HY814_15475 [Candidatus Riflebacteria bacterium]|nr:hypothetical protein [Candidatus Riflebacteria bacterium]
MKPTENRCPECGGQLVRVVTSRTLNVEGHPVFVEGLMPYECLACKEQVWPNAELMRAREQAAIKVRKAA